MNKELENIKTISGLNFTSAGKCLPFSGSGKKRRLPMFNISYNDVIPEPESSPINFRSLESFRSYVDKSKIKWEGEVEKKIQAGIDKLVEAGYTIEDPILLTYVYKYSSFFIYKEKYEMHIM